MSKRRSFLMTGALLASGGAFSATESDWPGASPESQGMNASRVTDTLQAGEAVPGLRALLVARNGNLLAERYYADATAETLQPINSATKSVCSLLVGLALRDGRLKSLDETVAQLLPDAAALVPDSPALKVSLRQILTGRSGFAYDPAAFFQLASAPSLLRLALSRPGDAVSSGAWTYNDAMVALLAPMLEHAQGGELPILARMGLFEPLGIERFQWRRDRQGNALAPGGLALRTRDLLKFSACMLEGGRWKGVQVIPEAWVQESLTPQVAATWRPGPVTDVGYGLLWFTGRLHGHRVAWAWGYGGQFALLAPELKLAVATAATSPPPQALGEQTDAVMTLVGRMLQAVG